jgi:hypothetical protein
LASEKSHFGKNFLTRCFYTAYDTLASKIGKASAERCFALVGKAAPKN